MDTPLHGHFLLKFKCEIARLTTNQDKLKKSGRDQMTDMEKVEVSSGFLSSHNRCLKLSDTSSALPLENSTCAGINQGKG
jgi:hypothetical protein